MATIPIDIEADRFQTVEDAVRAVLSRWQEKFHVAAKRINNGKCENFACAVDYAYDGTLTITGCEIDGLDSTGPWGGHVWVTDGFLHYDAEAPTGVDHWRHLPFYVRLEKNAGPNLHERMTNGLEAAGLA
jgi:hypothetical protein